MSLAAHVPSKSKSRSASNATRAALPLCTLLSQVLVAFTIEFDNEAEHRMPHRTTTQGKVSAGVYAPWLVSMVMWFNCMRFVGDEGVRVGELEKLARTKTNLPGMTRWGYIVIAPDPTEQRAKPPHSAWIIRATPAGRAAQQIWRPLLREIETRWEERFGKDQIAALKTSLWAIAKQMDAALPDCLPILKYGLFSSAPGAPRHKSSAQEHLAEGDLPLPALLARLLLAFALEFERELDLSLAICADVLRVLDEKGIRVRDLPMLSGVSKEALSMAMGILRKKRLVAVERDSGGATGKLIKLTSQGSVAKGAYERLQRKIEEQWALRFGKDALHSLREALERLVGGATPETSPLFQGLEPYPDGWRASVRKPSTLPHYPMVLHRGGFPDGS